MKNYFKYLMMFAVLAIGLASCSNDDDNVNGDNESVVTKDPKTVSLTINHGKVTTYADEGSAVGVTPTLSDAKVFFIGNGVVVDQGTLTTGETTKVFTNVPGSATSVYIVANDGTFNLPAITTGTTLAELKANLNNITGQTNPQTSITLQGNGSITVSAGVYSSTVDIYPAVSRIEVKKIEAATSPAVSIPLESYTLEGIFINNTYTQLGLDYSTIPSTLTQGINVLNYGPTDGSSFVTGYLTEMRDYSDTGIGGATTTKTPTTSNGVWGYQVFPLSAAGTAITIGGELQSRVPHIILKIKDATATGYTLPTTSYLTVRNFVTDDASETAITTFEQGKVYTISSIAFGGEHLSTQPEVPTSTSVTVTVTVKPWTEAAIKPNL